MDNVILDAMGADVDCRRQRAEQVEVIQRRMELLAEEDRLLVDMYINHGATFRQLSQLTGQSERVLSRRIRQQLERLLDGRYVAIVRAARQFSPRERGVAYDHFLLGLSLRAIAAKRALGVSQVRTSIARLSRWLRRHGLGLATGKTPPAPVGRIT